MERFTATFWLNKRHESDEDLTQNAPHGFLTRLTGSRDGAATIFADHARHVSESRGVPVAWRIDGETVVNHTN